MALSFNTISDKLVTLANFIVSELILPIASHDGSVFKINILVV